MCASVCVRLRIEHNLNLRSTYQHLLPPDGRPEITTHHSRTALTVDYIMYTPGIHTHSNTHSRTNTNTHASGLILLNLSPLFPSLLKDTVTYPNGRGLHLLGRLSLVGQAELEEVNGLPNHHHSSDHLPLLARFRLCR